MIYSTLLTIVLLTLIYCFKSTRKAHKINEALAVSQEKFRGFERYKSRINGGKA